MPKVGGDLAGFSAGTGLGRSRARPGETCLRFGQEEPLPEFRPGTGSECGDQAKLCLRLQTESSLPMTVWQEGEQDLWPTGPGGYRACPGERVRERARLPQILPLLGSEGGVCVVLRGPSWTN